MLLLIFDAVINILFIGENTFIRQLCTIQFIENFQS